MIALNWTWIIFHFKLITDICIKATCSQIAAKITCNSSRKKLKRRWNFSEKVPKFKIIEFIFSTSRFFNKICVFILKENLHVKGVIKSNFSADLSPYMPFTCSCAYVIHMHFNAYAHILYMPLGLSIRQDHLYTLLFLKTYFPPLVSLPMVSLFFSLML